MSRDPLHQRLATAVIMTAGFTYALGFYLREALDSARRRLWRITK